MHNPNALRKRIWDDFNAGHMRYPNETLADAAERTLKKIERLKLFPGDNDWRTEWGQFCQMLNDLVEPVTGHNLPLNPDNGRDVTPYDREVA